MACLYRSVNYIIGYMPKKIIQAAPPKAAPRLDTRTRLVQTMLRLIWSSSYHAVSVDDICKAAGVQKGSFYHFFPSKAALAHEVFLQEWKECSAELDNVFSPSLSPLERFAKLGEVIMQEQLEKREEFGHVCGCPFATIGSELATQDETMRAQIEAVFSTHMRYVESALRDAVAEGILPANTQVKAKAKEIDNFLLGTLLVARIKNSLEPIEQAFSAGIYNILGVAAPKKRSQHARKTA